MQPCTGCAAFLVIVCLLLSSAFAFSQVPDGTVAGTVRDANGGRLTGAKVTASATAFTLSRAAVTDDKGEFRLPALSPGQYKVRVEAAGFAAQELTVRVAVAGNPTLDVVMKPATVQQSVKVSSQAASLTEEPVETTSNVIK